MAENYPLVKNLMPLAYRFLYRMLGNRRFMKL